MLHYLSSVSSGTDAKRDRNRCKEGQAVANPPDRNKHKKIIHKLVS
jgi:hypothetical protein